MEVKKSPKADLNRNSSLYFVLGLFVVLLLVWGAFEWKTYDEMNDYDISLNVEDMLDEEVPMTEQIKTPPPPPPPAAPEVIEVVEDEEEVEETVIESTETSQEEEIIEVDDIVVEEVDDDVEVPFAVIEDVPVFPGCESASDKKACFNEMMQKHIRKNFRYPERSADLDHLSPGNNDFQSGCEGLKYQHQSGRIVVDDNRVLCSGDVSQHGDNMRISMAPAPAFQIELQI